MSEYLFEIIATIAIIVGPISAVFITRYLDTHRENQARKYRIFSDLMRTRSAKLSPEHVDALNLVEVEFTGYPKVKEAWNKYMETLSQRLPSDQGELAEFIQKRDQMFIKLMQEVVNSIGLRNVDITDVMSRNYYPQGWHSDEETLRQLRLMMIAVLSGARPLSVRMIDQARWNGPFPPAPTVVANHDKPEQKR